MATSYTSSLGLALPVQGELSGTWGDIVNNYITTYLEAAVAGTQTISGSQTAVTLALNNGSPLTQAGTGATGSPQYTIINCTGNPASLLTVTVPAASKSYIVINSTSTSQSVKIVGAGPTTGVTLGVGEKALIAWNGSDFVKLDGSGGPATFSSITNTGLTSGRVVYSTTGGLETDSANLTFNGTTLTAGGLKAISAATQDSVTLQGRAGGTNSYGVTITPTTLSASRTVTLPNADINFSTGLGVAQGGTGLTSGTSGGVLYYSATGTLASSALLAASALVVGGGAGVAPSTITTGTGVTTALGVNTGSSGAFVVNGGALGTPSSGTVTNLTGTASININGTVGATTPTTATFTTGTALQIINTVNPVTVTSNAGTVPITYRINNFTNSSAATMTITLATASAVDGQMSIVRIYDFSAAAQNINWVNTENSTVTVPATSNGSITLPLTVGFMYNSQTSKWRCIASA